MMNKSEIKKWIIKSKNKGYSIKDIKKEVKKHDYNSNFVDKVLYKKKKKNIIFASLISLFIFIIILFFLFKSGITQNYVNKGFDYYFNGNYNNAIEQFDNAIKKNPDNSEAYNGLGWVYYMQERYEDAKKQFNKAIGLNPEHFYAYAGLGWCSYQELDFKLAEEYFSKSIGLSQNGEAHSGLGHVFFQQQQYDKAIVNLKKAIELNALSIDTIYTMLGNSYLSRRKDDSDLDNAKINFQEAIKINENNAFAHNGLGIVYLHMPKKDTLAFREFNRCSQLNPNFEGCYIGLGRTYEIQGKYTNAIDNFKMALELNPQQNPNKITTHHLLGDTYIYIDKYDLAINQFDMALEIDPNYYPIYISLGDLYLRQKSYEKAFENLKKALELKTYNIDHHYIMTSLGRYYLGLEDYNTALDKFGEAIKISLGDTKNYCLKFSGKGLALFYLNKFELAKEAYSKVSDIESYCDLSKELKEKLQNKNLI